LSKLNIRITIGQKGTLEVPSWAADWVNSLLADEMAPPESPDPSFRKECLEGLSVLVRFPLDGLHLSSGPAARDRVEAALRQELAPIPASPVRPNIGP
jgi:hypothetical protein